MQVKQEFPKWLYSRTLGGRVIKDALEEAQLDTYDEWRDTPWPESPKPVTVAGVKAAPCQNCAELAKQLKEQGESFDKSWSSLQKDHDELKSRYNTLTAEFKAVSLVSPKPKQVADAKPVKNPEAVETAKE